VGEVSGIGRRGGGPAGDENTPQDEFEDFKSPPTRAGMRGGGSVGDVNISQDAIEDFTIPPA